MTLNKSVAMLKKRFPGNKPPRPSFVMTTLNINFFSKIDSESNHFVNIGASIRLHVRILFLCF